MAVVALLLAVFTVGNVGQTAASLSDSASGDFLAVEGASIKAVSDITATPAVIFSAGTTEKTGSLTITNSGNTEADYRTVTTATGSPPLAGGVKVWMWPSALTAGCATMPSNPSAGTWASFPALTGKLPAGGAQLICVKTTLTTPVGLATNTAVTATISTTLSRSSWTSDASSVVTQTFVDANPTAPTGLTFSGTTSASTTLNWTPATDDVRVTGYDVYRGATLIGSTSGATSFIVTGLTASTSYSFTVRARDGAEHTSAASSAATVTTLAVSAPTGWFQLVNSKSQLCIDASGAGTTSFTPLVQWTCSSPVATNQQWSFQGPNANGYYTVVPRHTASIIWDVEAASNNNAARIILYAPNLGTNQQWSVIAIGSDKYQFVARNSGKCMSVIGGATTTNAGFEQVTCNAADPAQTFSLRSIVAPDTTPPAVPTGLTATATSSTSVTLTWTASSDNVGVTEYLVYRNGSLLAARPSGTTFVDTGLTAGTSYSYRVLARDAAGNSSALSATAAATPPTPVPSLTCTSTTWEGRFSWTTPVGVDQSTLRYNLYVGGVKLNNVADGWNSYVLLNSATVPRTIPMGRSAVLVTRIMPNGSETAVGTSTVNIQYFQTTTDRTFMCG